jgi:hypothetical protein
MGRRSSLLLVALLAVLLALAGRATVVATRGAAGEPERAVEDGAVDSVGVADPASAPSAPAPVERRLIRKGNVSLASDDVAKAAFDVQRIADEHGGEVAEQKTTTDDEGEVSSARLVLRVPAAGFTAAFGELEDVADLRSSSSSAEDVTTQVIDTQVRIRAQRRSLRRVEVLLDRAQTIRDIVAIEAELTRRQAELESLEGRLAYLQDQTAMSTITVAIERVVDEQREEADEDDGFLAGLSAGWTALGTFATGLATVAGAVLPFVVVLGLLGVPVLALLRRGRRRAAPADA